MLRIWSLNDKISRKDLHACLETLPILEENGRWFDRAYARRHKAPWNNRKYGDILWLANNGVLVFPDFYHRDSPYKGMHGYDPALPESKGMCIRWGAGINSNKNKEIPLHN